MKSEFSANYIDWLRGVEIADLSQVQATAIARNS